MDNINLPHHFQFIEADVENLYPSININDALDAIHAFLFNRLGFPQTRINFIIKLVEWVLKNNYISFGEYIYHQIQGTAMGTPCAVVVACIFMHIIEEEALSLFSIKRCIPRTIFLFKRFIDDYIIVITDYDSGIDLMELLNSRRNSINITFKIRNREIHFLDITLLKTYPNHQLVVKAYTKPMNKHLFLPQTSCHPPHIFSGWICGYARRLKLNCTNNSDYNHVLNNFKANLINRGYKESMITEIFNKIPDRKHIIDSIINKSTTSTAIPSSIGVPFVITYSHDIQTLLPMIKQALFFTEEAHMDPHFDVIFPKGNTPLFVFKRSRNRF